MGETLQINHSPLEATLDITSESGHDTKINTEIRQNILFWDVTVCAEASSRIVY